MQLSNVNDRVEFAKDQVFLFSVIIPTFNRAHLITKAIECVLNQTFSDFELIIVDDGSSDNTREVIEQIRDCRIHYISQQNQGWANARNTGVQRARGQYVTFLDSDDEVTSDWLEKFSQEFKKPNVGIAWCGAKVITSDGKHEKLTILLPKSLGVRMEDQNGAFLAGTYALPREILLAVGGHDQKSIPMDNTELMFRLFPYCAEFHLHVATIPQPLFIYHKRSYDPSRIKIESLRFFKGIEYILGKHSKYFQTHPDIYAIFCKVAGVHAARLQNYSTARSYFLRALRYKPFNLKNYLRLSTSFIPSVREWVWIKRYDQQVSSID